MSYYGLSSAGMVAGLSFGLSVRPSFGLRESVIPAKSLTSVLRTVEADDNPGVGASMICPSPPCLAL